MGQVPEGEGFGVRTALGGGAPGFYFFCGPKTDVVCQGQGAAYVSDRLRTRAGKVLEFNFFRQPSGNRGIEGIRAFSSATETLTADSTSTACYSFDSQVPCSTDRVPNAMPDTGGGYTGQHRPWSRQGRGTPGGASSGSGTAGSRPDRRAACTRAGVPE